MSALWYGRDVTLVWLERDLDQAAVHSFWGEHAEADALLRSLLPVVPLWLRVLRMVSL